MTADPVLGPPYQLAYVTADLTLAMEALAGLGVAEFARIDDVVLTSEAGTSATISMALAWAGDTMVELIEPRGGGDGVFRDGLPDGPGTARFHHLCYRMATLEDLAAMRARLEAAGVALLFPCDSPGRSSFFYADLRPTLGHLVEYLYVAPERLPFHAGLPAHRAAGVGRPRAQEER
jgi:hypothetical protein